MQEFTKIFVSPLPPTTATFIDKEKNPKVGVLYISIGKIKKPKHSREMRKLTPASEKKKAMTRKEKEEEKIEEKNKIKPLFSIEKIKPRMKKYCLD